MGIVGAGPAGAWAGYRLATCGARVAIFDHSHPREKPCGGGITGRALSLLGESPAVATLSSVSITGARFEAPDGGLVRVALPPGEPAVRPPLVIASRRAFDEALLRTAVAAGATLVPERVLSVGVTRRGAELRTTRGTYQVPLLLGADGANSLVRRRVARPFERSQLSIAAGYFVDGISDADIAIRFTADPPGYAWSFPRPDHLAVGACAEASLTGVEPLRNLVGAWLDGSTLTATAPRRRYSWPVPSLDRSALDREEPSGDRWMLLGDAAGLVDPITREGIYFALRSAEIAADAISAHPGRERDAYASRLRAEIHTELRRAARLRRGFFRPAFVQLLHRALRQSEAVRAIMVDLMAGRQTYQGLQRRLLATLEIGLAWRLFRLP